MSPAVTATSTSPSGQSPYSETSTMVDVDAAVTPEKVPVAVTDASTDAPKSAKKGASFWLIMLSLAITTFLSALDLTAISTALPVIAEDLKATDFTWIGSAYALSSTAFLPVFGGLADVFGRKPNLMASIVIFAVGSAVCGSAATSSSIIIGRTIQGVGGGGILTLVEITIADLVPLAERGAYFGYLGLVWAISSAIGPVMGGTLAESNWRWLFYLNLPLAGVSLVLVFCFMNLKIPQGSVMSKLGKVDWIGSLIFVAAATLLIAGMTFGGVEFPWASAGTLAPLLIGIFGLGVFGAYERLFAKNSILPFEIFNLTTVIGYLTTFLHGVVSIGVFYYFPVWFQAVLGAGPVDSGIDLFPSAFLIAPMAIAVGVSTTITGQYKPQNIAGWVFLTVGMGLLTLIQATTSRTFALGIQAPMAIGLGILYASTGFAVLAPLPPALNAHAMAFHAFSRSFGQVFGITIGSVVLTNQLAQRLPAAASSALPGGASDAYSAIPMIKDIPEPLRSAIRAAFSDSVRIIWFVLLGLAAVGLFASVFIKAIKLNSATDEAWAIVDKKAATQQAQTIEKTASAV